MKQPIKQESIDHFLTTLQDFLVDVEPEIFSDPGVRFGIGDWSITLISNSNDEGAAVFQLLQTRKDLLAPVIRSDGWWSFFRSISPLYDWLESRDYKLKISGNTFWTRIATRILGVQHR